MCHFISWINFNDQIYFLKNSDFYQPEGKRLLGYDYLNDIEGHGAILHYYPELKNKKYIQDENENFSNPKAFPKEIVEAIKNGEVSITGLPIDVLTRAAKKELSKKCKKSNAKLAKLDCQCYKFRDNILDYSSKHCRRSVEFYNHVDVVMERLIDSIHLENKLEKAKIFSNIVKKKENRTKVWR